MDFASFVLLNLILFIRPQELVPALYGFPLFNVGFFICLACTLPALLAGGTLRSVFGQPIGACVLALGGFAVLSNLGNGHLGGAVEAGDSFLKSVLYYLLLIVNVRTTRRLKWFFASFVISGALVSAIGVVDYKEIIHFPQLAMTIEFKVVDGEQVPFRRLGSTSIFGDPNDLGLLIVGTLISFLCLVTDRAVPLALRALWLAPLAVLVQALLLTYSRGAMLSLLVGLAVYAIARFGRKALIPMALALPAILARGGRQMDFSVSAGTAQSRVQLWDVFIGLFISRPVFGVGFGHGTDYSELVAHNSYLHAFGELGFGGGVAFLSAMLLSLVAVYRVGRGPGPGPDPELARLRPFMLAFVASYAFGLMSLSRCYVMPTYTTLGLAAAFERLAESESGHVPIRLTPRLVGLLVLFSLAFLVAMFIFIKKNANYV